MLRFSVILVVVATGVLAEDECMRFLQHGAALRCCKGNLPMPSDELKQAYKECHNLPHGEKTCDRELCVATKRGYVKADGKLDLVKIQEKLEKEMETSPALFKGILERCVNGDISGFGTPDTCEPTKFMRCSELQFVKVGYLQSKKGNDRSTDPWGTPICETAAENINEFKQEAAATTQHAVTCPEWKNDGPCEGLKDISEGCQKKFNV